LEKGYAIDVFSHHIELNIYYRTFVYVFDIGMLEGVGNNGYRKLVAGNVENGKAGAVEANRAFFNNQGCKLIGEAETELPTAIQFLAANAGSRCIYMALNNMP